VERKCRLGTLGSFACSLTVHRVNLSLIHPRLFAALVLLDPVIELGSTTGSNSSKTGGGKYSIATASTYRRDLWPSREDAENTFRKNPFYQRWDKRVLNAWLIHGLRELPTALYPDPTTPMASKLPVTLKTSKHQEVWTYLRPNYYGRSDEGIEMFDRKSTPDLSPGSPHSYPFYRAESSITFHKLPFVRPPVFYILGEESTLSSPEFQRDKVKMTGTGAGGSGGIAAGQVKDVVLPGIGHLVPLEAPDATAQEAVNWLSTAMQQWRTDEDCWAKARRARPPSHHLRVNEEWLKHIGTMPGRDARGNGPKL
jgi:pimeloyl-ACP methyl ester carboxylesterase